MALKSKQALERKQLVFRDRQTFEALPIQPVRGTDQPRHDRQKQLIDQLSKKFPSLAPTSPSGSTSLLNRAFREYDYDNRRIGLFNIIVALEWVPDEQDLQSLKATFTQASDMLYDVTDGYMAIGQVVVGGQELMGCADIQIFASNRLFPRAFVNGLNISNKYQPIRVGRGLWNKNERSIFTWNEEIGYKTIVHEWAHYALGLKDQYLILDQGLVIPSKSLVKNTIMADMSNASELLSTRVDSWQNTPQKWPYSADSEWKGLSLNPRFSSLHIDPKHQPIDQPPPEIPVPAFRIIGTALDTPQKLLFAPQAASTQDRLIDPEHCWVYIIKGDVGTNSARLLAQGSLEKDGRELMLLGAEVGDLVVLIGNQKGSPSTSLVLQSKITGVDTSTGMGVAIMDTWYNATPTFFPIVDVTATSTSVTPPYSIEISGFDTTKWTAITFPLGQQGKGEGTTVTDLSVLDGHVLLVSKDREDLKLAISNYSVGGSPGNSGDPGHPNPLPAGSADGNAMIFFFDEERGPLQYEQIYGTNGNTTTVMRSSKTFNDEAFKIVTTTNLRSDVPPPAGWEPRSYTFSVASNHTFADIVDLHPTLVLYYDVESKVNAEGEMVIARYSGESEPHWVLLDKTRDCSENYFAAVALEDDQAEPGLFKRSPEPDHFRLFVKVKTDITQQ
jgi:hypothetical protein